jgi:hypothetical protein
MCDIVKSVRQHRINGLRFHSCRQIVLFQKIKFKFNLSSSQLTFRRSHSTTTTPFNNLIALLQSRQSKTKLINDHAWTDSVVITGLVDGGIVVSITSASFRSARRDGRPSSYLDDETSWSSYASLPVSYMNCIVRFTLLHFTLLFLNGGFDASHAVHCTIQ